MITELPENPRWRVPELDLLMMRMEDERVGRGSCEDDSGLVASRSRSMSDSDLRFALRPRSYRMGILSVIWKHGEESRNGQHTLQSFCRSMRFMPSRVFLSGTVDMVGGERAGAGSEKCVRLLAAGAAKETVEDKNINGSILPDDATRSHAREHRT